MHEREHEDEDLGDQEDPHVQQERPGDVRERLAEDRRIEERLLDVVPARRADDGDGDQPDDDERAGGGDGDRPASAGRRRAEDAGASAAGQRATGGPERRPARGTSAGAS